MILAILVAVAVATSVAALVGLPDRSREPRADRDEHLRDQLGAWR